MLYLDLFHALSEHHVRYVLVGGLALNLHGVERSTMDIDLAIALDQANLAATLDAAEKLRLVPVAPVSLREAADPRTLARWRREKNMIAFALRPQAGAGPTVDLLIDLPIAFDLLFERATTKCLQGIQISVASIDDMILLKRASGRPLDLADVAALESLKRLGLDK
ncbi:MAG: nucleotidyl transferase AbiEii/AbiGii toxin family protein [Betaproteobacteria bacterium]